MTRVDWLAGVKHAWHLDRAPIMAFAGYQTLLALLAVIMGAAAWVPVAMLCGALVPVVTNTVRRARNARDSREFYEWLIEVDEGEDTHVDVE